MDKKIKIMSLNYDNLSLLEAAADIVEMASTRIKGIILPVNVDQLVVIEQNRNIKAIYKNALRIFADGMPIVWLSIIIGKPLKERVTGSDLTPEICKYAANKNIKLFFFGAKPGIAERAARRMEEKYPGLQSIDTYSPPMGFENNEEEIRNAIKIINKSSPDILFLALGFPKQELFATKHMTELNVGPIVSIGATLDFISGEVKRAPIILRKIGCEWLWRLMQEPRRLWRRYLIRGPVFIRLALKAILKKGTL